MADDPKVEKIEKVTETGKGSFSTTASQPVDTTDDAWKGGVFAEDEPTDVAIKRKKSLDMAEQLPALKKQTGARPPPPRKQGFGLDPMIVGFVLMALGMAAALGYLAMS